ncbi:FAD-dependent oxidoreductase [Streptomyces sp. ET3-23]|uniref:FAD-dependent oxidoreductase n=1 Tax=Streptomyces sp. ET3-23 TaxID=2885643 RepID=UPI001D12364C|nr:FAD-dependent oxidoreductase [Streptomyces sp. ET3-23]MCC2277971.1 FAD-dependent oxidoreductase [Streptomyces sp. ET3-23]
MSTVVVVGAGIAAHRFVERLRHHGHRGEVTVLGAEPVSAYHRVLLPAVLDGTLPPAALRLPALPGATVVRTGTEAVRIDRRRRLVRTADGAAHRYDHLVLATGAGPVLPDVPGLRAADGTPARGVTGLRTLADCTRVRGRVVVLGGGVLGVEAALALRRAGRPVALVHRHPRLMNRQLDSTAAGLLAGHLADRGVQLHLDRSARAHAPGSLTLDDGRVLLAGTVLVCAGTRPRAGIARTAGLAVGRGVLVDDSLTTEDPRIHAIGDCAEHRDQMPALATAAWEQADVLARLLTNRPARYHPGRPVTRVKAPGLDLAVYGTDGAVPEADETITLTDPARRRYARLTLQGHRLTGAVLVGYPQAIAALGPLWDRDVPVPSDVPAFLHGTVPGYRDTEDLPDDAVVCHCNTVTRRTLADSWSAGARSVAALAGATRATTGCGGCADAVRDLCAGLHSAARPAGADR